MKETYYFSHDSNARNDEKILMLRAEHGWEGYGIYWMLVEMMFESRETCLSHKKIKGMAAGNNIVITLLQEVINTCIAEELFESNDDFFWSNSLRKRKEKLLNLKLARSEAGKKAMEKRWKDKNPVSESTEKPGSDNRVITELYQSNSEVITKNNKGKERKGKEIKGKESVHTHDVLFLAIDEAEKMGKDNPESYARAMIKNGWKPSEASEPLKDPSFKPYDPSINEEVDYGFEF